MSASTLSTFQRFALFPDAESARLYLESRRWPEGARCPVCAKGDRIGDRKGGYYRCHACREDFSVRVGTIFERSHVPLPKWLYAMYLLVTARKGISSLQLSKQIGVTPKTACFMLHRLRETDGMKRPDVLDAVADRVLAYQPAPKSRKAKKRRRKRNAKRRQAAPGSAAPSAG